MSTVVFLAGEGAGGGAVDEDGELDTAVVGGGAEVEVTAADLMI
jgi:hypothetical protein